MPEVELGHVFTQPTQPAVPVVPASGDVKPGIKTSEGQFAGVAGIGLLIPIINAVLSKQGDTRFEVGCLTLLAIVYICARTYAKRTYFVVKYW